jgi:predicted enzyme related to lactoylglutathione lyase
MAAAMENGGQILFGPMEVAEVGTFVGITDPTGASFTVIELATAID